MNSNPNQRLLLPDDAAPVSVVNPQGASTFLLLGDHAGRRIPRALCSLGVSQHDLARHIAWDIGVAELGAALAEKIDATFLSQTYSRLVIDCNRDPSHHEAIPSMSDGTHIPGNDALSTDDRCCRVAEVHNPYQTSIATELATRDDGGRSTILVSLHSFTPNLNGVQRPWDIGILYSDGKTDFARALLALLEQQADLSVGDNEPYAMDATDYTIPRHAFCAERPYVEIEIRQDLLTGPRHWEQWSRLLARLLLSAASAA